MYYIEDVVHQEQFTIKVLDGIIIRYEHVWAYSEEEAKQDVESRGLEIID